MQNKDTCSAVCRLKLLSIMMMFVFDNELGILSVRIQIQKKKNKHSSMRWLQIEDGDWGGTAETKHETRAECWVPEWSLVIHSRVIVTDHQVLESVVCMDQDLCRVMEFSSSSRSALSSTYPSLSAQIAVRNSSQPSNTTNWLQQKQGNDWKSVPVFFSRLRMFLVSCFHYCQGQVGSSCPSHLFMFLRAS